MSMHLSNWIEENWEQGSKIMNIMQESQQRQIFHYDEYLITTKQIEMQELITNRTFQQVK
jgi:hypothetical protein